MTLPTPDDVVGMGEQHGEHAQSAVGKCRWCGVPWPCDVARLLALVDSQALRMQHLENVFAQQDDRLAAVLAECEWIATMHNREHERVFTTGDGTEVRDALRDIYDRIRRAANGGTP